MLRPLNIPTKNKRIGLCFLVGAYEANISNHPQSDLRAIGGFFLAYRTMPSPNGAEQGESPSPVRFFCFIMARIYATKRKSKIR